MKRLRYRQLKGTQARKGQSWNSNQGDLSLKSLLLPTRLSSPGVAAHSARPRGSCTNPGQSACICLHTESCYHIIVPQIPL